MDQGLTIAGNCAFVMLAIVAIGFWGLGAWNMLLMVRRRKPGVPYRRNFWSSPYNIVFRPSDLTPEGLKARRRMFWGAGGFMVCWGIGLMVGMFVIGDGAGRHSNAKLPVVRAAKHR